jgi:hypothetical protein
MITTRISRWYRLDVVPNREDFEAAIDRAMVEGYTRIPDDDEFDGLAEVNARMLIAEEPW